jgi:hypothetical protein
LPTESLPGEAKPKTSKLYLLPFPFTLKRMVAYYLLQGRETQ